MQPPRELAIGLGRRVCEMSRMLPRGECCIAELG